MCDIHTEVFITIIEGDPFEKGASPINNYKTLYENRTYDRSIF